jgi:hypothetical protein
MLLQSADLYLGKPYCKAHYPMPVATGATQESSASVGYSSAPPQAYAQSTESPDQQSYEQPAEDYGQQGYDQQGYDEQYYEQQ